MLFCLLHCIFLDVVLEEAIGAQTESVVPENTPCRTKVRVCCFIFRGKVKNFGSLRKGNANFFKNCTVTFRIKPTFTRVGLLLQF